MSEAGDRWLQGLRDHPEWLPQAPQKPTDEQIKNRARETHVCMFCGELAERAFSANMYADESMTVVTDSRWIDLCKSCAEWIVDNDDT